MEPRPGAPVRQQRRRGSGLRGQPQYPPRLWIQCERSAAGAGQPGLTAPPPAALPSGHHQHVRPAQHVQLPQPRSQVEQALLERPAVPYRLHLGSLARLRWLGGLGRRSRRQPADHYRPQGRLRAFRVRCQAAGRRELYLRAAARAGPEVAESRRRGWQSHRRVAAGGDRHVLRGAAFHRVLKSGCQQRRSELAQPHLQRRARQCRSIDVV